MSGRKERNTEIWSTRLQRELLALTTSNAPDETTEEVTAVLPPFVSVKEHKLDISGGVAYVSFLVELPLRETDDKTTEPIEITLDASLGKKGDGSIDETAIVYPFCSPTILLSSGANRFPTGSTIENGHMMPMDMDWTPSLHLTDAILNITLKIKECISQGEPFHGLQVESTPDAVDAVVNSAKRLGATFSKGLRGLAGSNNKKADGTTKQKKGLRLPGRKKKKSASPKNVSAEAPGEVRIGMEINMLEAPWVECQGVYSCKAIRRPPFVEDAIAIAAANAEKNAAASGASDGQEGSPPSDDIQEFMQQQAKGIEKAANAGISGAGAMLRTFTQSARSVLEESFLMITETHIVEMRSNKLNLSTGIVNFAIPIEMLAKLKFRRQESISLFFKPAPDDPLIYMCPDSADCVHQIQAVLKRHGVKGKHTNAATHRAINQALHLVQEIQTKELALKHDPSVDRVNEIMDLYRQAAERFEVAGDVRHEEVVTHMRKFLALSLTASILDGSYRSPEDEDGPIAADKGAASGGKVVERVNEDKDFEKSMDNMLKEAEADLANMEGDADDPELDAMIEEQAQLGLKGDDDDAVADFENMLREADNELAALMNSS